MNNILEKRKILVVEDNEDDQILLSEAFEKHPDNTLVIFKNSCLKALSAMSLENFDFFLIDFRLGVLDAHPVIRRLLLFGCPFAVFSGSSEEEIREELCEISSDIKFYSKRDIEKIPGLIHECLV
jgi:CheY-like chemotaxis protein